MQWKDTHSRVNRLSSIRDERRPAFLAIYLLLGIAFGVVLTKSEVLSWFRIQEMFRFQSFRSYGIIGSAIATAALSLKLSKRTHLKSIAGEVISVPEKQLGSGIRYAARRHDIWSEMGPDQCLPGTTVCTHRQRNHRDGCAVFSALFGTWIYGLLRSKLPR
jgi:uncharacterized protein